MQTSPLKMAVVLEALADRVGRPVAIVAHSLGGVVTNFALRQGLQPEAVVLVASPTGPELFFRRMLKIARIPDRQRVVRAAEHVFSRRFADVEVGPALRDTPTLLVHDAHDQQVPVESQHTIASNLIDVELLTTEGLGHVRILDDAKVIKAGQRFISHKVGDLSFHSARLRGRGWTGTRPSSRPRKFSST